MWNRNLLYAELILILLVHSPFYFQSGLGFKLRTFQTIVRADLALPCIVLLVDEEE